jgi:hypothetical protein
MSETEIRNYTIARGFHPRTLERWLSWEPADRDALGQLAKNLKIGENHLRDLMDWLEEIGLRDRLTIHDVLRSKTIADIETDPRLGRADKLKRIKEQVRRLRFPRLAETEDAIRHEIQSLKLVPEIRLSVPSGLEEGSLQVEFKATSHDELKRMVAQLNNVAEKDSVREIFALLAGQPTMRSQS